MEEQKLEGRRELMQARGHHLRGKTQSGVLMVDEPEALFRCRRETYTWKAAKCLLSLQHQQASGPLEECCLRRARKNEVSAPKLGRLAKGWLRGSCLEKALGVVHGVAVLAES